MTSTEIEPGALFTARDGNSNTYTDARYVAAGEKTDFILDVDGSEVRKGDYVEILDTNRGEGDWTGRVCVVTQVSRGRMYGTPDGHNDKRHAWSPTCGLNGASVVYRKRHSTGFGWKYIRKVNLTEEDGQRLLLMELLDERATVDMRMADLQSERVKLNLQVARIRETLGEGERG